MVDNRGLTPQQTLALSLETQTAVQLIDHGLAELWRLNATNDFYHLPMQLLASGLERILKLTVALATLESTGRLTVEKTHDIEALAYATVRRVQGMVELQTALQDEKLVRLLKVLTAFGERGRYYYIDMFKGEPQEGDSPEDAWQQIELEFAQDKREGWAERLARADRNEVFAEIAAHTTTLVQKFITAIAMGWVRGEVGPLGRRHQPYLSHHMMHPPGVDP